MNPKLGQRFLLLRRLAWATSFTFGFGTIWSVLLMISGETLPERIIGPELKWPVEEQLVVMTDGTPLIRRQTRGIHPSSGSYVDLNGKHVSITREDREVRPFFLPNTNAASKMFTRAVWPLIGPPRWPLRLRAFADKQRSDLIWYFIHDGTLEGAGYFVGYVQSTHKRVGFIGVSGFHQHSVPVSDRFPVRLWLFDSHWSYRQQGIADGVVRMWSKLRANVSSQFVYVPSTDCVRLVDLDARTVQIIFESSDPIEAFAIRRFLPYEEVSPKSDETDSGVACLVRTANRIYALSPDHSVIREFEIPPGADPEASVTWHELRNGQAVVAFFRDENTVNGHNFGPCNLYRIAEDGAILEKIDLSLDNGMLKWNQQRSVLTLRLALPVPVLLPFVEAGMLCLIDQAEVSDAIWSVLRQAWPSYLTLSLISLLLVLASMRRANAYGLAYRERIVWTVFVFLFGIPGYVGFRLHRRWPLLWTCRHCSTRVPLNQPTCAQCDLILLDADPRGIEVFV